MFARTYDPSDFGFPSVMIKEENMSLLISVPCLPLFPFFQRPFFLLQDLSHKEDKKISRSFQQSWGVCTWGLGEVFKPVPLGVRRFSLRAVQPTFLPCLTGLKLCLGCNKSQPCPQRSSCSPFHRYLCSALRFKHFAYLDRF